MGETRLKVVEARYVKRRLEREENLAALAGFRLSADSRGLPLENSVR